MNARLSSLVSLAGIASLLISMALGHRAIAQHHAAKGDSLDSKVYRTNPKLEIPIFLVVIGGASFGFKAVDKLASLDETSVAKLDPATINSFDRPVAYYNPQNFEQAQKTSDLLLPLFVASPVCLLLDKNIRGDWQDYVSIVFAAHGADNVMYFSSVLSVRRPRPLAFNPATPIQDKIGDNKTNSFFSGHVTWTATSTFLMAKVYSDYYKIKGLRRILLYAAASVPPAVMGYYRMEAGKHFPSDVLTGFVVGAATGILVPALHANRTRPPQFSFRPFSMNDTSGVTLIYHF
jgi:membrane-associated phospholipid phosphatase